MTPLSPGVAALTIDPRPPDRAGPSAGDAGTRRRSPAGRLLAGLPATHDGPRSLADHRRVHAVPPPPGDRPWPELVALIDRAGLSGRGGAGFPTGRKLLATSRGNGRGRPVVVANGMEGEPASAKDRLLLTRLPHLVIDGALLAAAAVGADQVVVCLDRTDERTTAVVGAALAERAATERAGVDVRIAEVPPRFVAGEASALAAWLDGGAALPTVTPPHLAAQGVGGRPTLVQNVETLAHLAQIAQYGPEWFRQVGTVDEPGTALVTVSGGGARQCVLEATLGVPVGRLLAAAWVTQPLQAVLVGGFYGTWAAADLVADTPFSRAGLSWLGASPGAGVLIALPAGACGLAETARVLRWFSDESAGQCGPCLYGLADLATGAASLVAGGPSGAGASVAQLRRWAGEIDGRGACRHPDGAVRLLRSALHVFDGDVARHQRGEPCAGASGPALLPVPGGPP